MMPPRPSVGIGAVIQDEGHRLLLVQRAHPPQMLRWAVPGGHLEWHESLKEGVQREVLEEVGLYVSVGEILHVAEIRVESAHFIVIDFAATAENVQSAHPQSDAKDLIWADADHIGKLLLAEGMSELIASPAVRQFLGWRMDK
ncbi:MAG: NUDIX domain-containing protein [Firmicutes bacterium]|nr:NUDIX domain-containing protein [Bacillota bacterium]